MAGEICRQGPGAAHGVQGATGKPCSGGAPSLFQNVAFSSCLVHRGQGSRVLQNEHGGQEPTAQGRRGSWSRDRSRTWTDGWPKVSIILFHVPSSPRWVPESPVGDSFSSLALLHPSLLALIIWYHVYSWYAPHYFSAGALSDYPLTSI